MLTLPCLLWQGKAWNKIRPVQGATQAMFMFRGDTLFLSVLCWGLQHDCRFLCEDVGDRLHRRNSSVKCRQCFFLRTAEKQFRMLQCRKVFILIGAPGLTLCDKARLQFPLSSSLGYVCAGFECVWDLGDPLVYRLPYQRHVLRLHVKPSITSRANTGARISTRTQQTQ